MTFAAPAHSASLFAVFFFVLGVSHSGARIGRKTYLVDMADQGNRASYVAISNTLTGIALLVASSIGLLSAVVGDTGIILVLALMALGASAVALRLPEVQ